MLFLNEEKLNLAKVKKEFFPYFHVENALSQELDSLDLINDFPDIEAGGSFPSDDLAEGFIKQLVQELEGSEFKSILENKLDIDLQETEVITTLRGYSRARDGKIHTDSQSKVLTVLLYLNKDWNESWGGALQLASLEKSGLEVSQSIMPNFNKTVIFTTTDSSYHGHPEPMNLPNGRARNSLALYYYVSQKPKETSALKRLQTDYRFLDGSQMHN